MNEAENPIM